MKSASAKSGGQIVWPAFFSPPGPLRQALAGLESSQWLPPEDLLLGQQRQLAELLRWAYEKAPLYRRFGRRAIELARPNLAPERFWEQWRQLPLLTKSDLRTHGSRLTARNVPDSHLPLNPLLTSGSTGIPVEVQGTAATRLCWDALTVREHLWRGRDFAKHLGVIRYFDRQHRDAKGIALPDWGAPVNRLYATGPASALHIGHPVEVLADWLRRRAPHYLLTYPSIASALLDALPEKPPALEEVRLISEPVDPALERRLAETWQVRCADSYSSNEVGYIAFRCLHGQLHLQSEGLLVEILDDQGAPCAVGETGRVVVSALCNLAMPLLRYDLGDYAAVGAPCACGRGLPVISQVLGRVRNLARAPDGRPFWPVDLGAVRAVKAVRQAQYVQTALDAIQMRLVLERALTQDEHDRIVDRVRYALGYPFRVDIVRVEQIERGPTGKFEEFRSEIP